MDDVTDQTGTSETCEAALRRICLKSCLDLDAALAIFQISDDVRGPHKARVALRRLTTCLDAFSSLMRKKPQSALRAEAKSLFRALGKVRDIDVYLSNATDLSEDGARSGKDGRMRETVRAQFRRKKAASFSARLVAALAPEGGLLRKGAKGMRLRQAQLSAMAIQLVLQQWDECRSFGPLVTMIPKPRRHDFRKSVKSMRYLMEFFSDPLSEPSAKLRRSDLRELQDVLGVLSDFDAALGIEGRKPPKILPPREASAMAQAEVLWARLQQSPPEWPGQPTRAP